MKGPFNEASTNRLVSLAHGYGYRHLLPRQPASARAVFRGPSADRQQPCSALSGAIAKMNYILDEISSSGGARGKGEEGREGWHGMGSIALRIWIGAMTNAHSTVSGRANANAHWTKVKNIKIANIIYFNMKSLPPISCRHHHSFARLVN